MKNELVNTKRISISNFTFDSKTNTISFFSTKTNKCWSKDFCVLTFAGWYYILKMNPSENVLNNLKKLIKNGSN